MALVDLHLTDGEAQPDIDPDRGITWPIRFLLLLLLVGTAFYGLRLFVLPLPIGAIAPTDEFSSSRALSHVEVVSAAAPSGIETALASSLAALGLVPEAMPAGSRGVAARLRGTQPTGTILLVTPYDAAGSAPGLAGAATIMESLRAFLTGPRPKNDVVVLFSATRPLDERVLAAFDAALVFRLERISERGPVALVAASSGTGALVPEALRVLPHPTVTFEPLDLGARPASRVPTLSFAAIGGPSMLSGADPRTVQDAGATALALLRRFGSAALPVPAAPDVVAVTVGQDQIVTYPAAWSRTLGIAAALVAIALLAVGFLRKKLTASSFATGLVLYPLIGAIAWVFGLAALSLLLKWNPGGHLLPWGTLPAAWFTGAVVLLSLALASLFVTRLRASRRTPSADSGLASAGLAWWAFFALVAGFRYPDLAPLAAVPALLLVPAFLVLFFTDDVSHHPWLSGTALAVTALPTVLLIAPVLRLLDVAAGWIAPSPNLSVAALPAAVSALVAALLLPHLSLPKRRWLFPALFFVVAAGLLVAGLRF